MCKRPSRLTLRHRRSITGARQRSSCRSVPTPPEDQEVLRAYSKLATAQAGLLAAHDFNAEAEQAYRLATEICPDSPEAVFRYVNLLLTQQRFADAVPVVETAVKGRPE